MSKRKRKKTEYINTDDAEQETERETGDIYDDEQRRQMLKADGITAAENAFVQGREVNPKKRKRPEHEGTISVQVAEDEYREDSISALYRYLFSSSARVRFSNS